jgi:hypothetical protein
LLVKKSASTNKAYFWVKIQGVSISKDKGAVIGENQGAALYKKIREQLLVKKSGSVY